MTKATDLRRIFLISLIASVATSAVIGIGVLLLGNFGSVEVRVLMTTMAITIVSVLGLACGAYIEIRGGKLLPYAGIALSHIAGLMSTFIIWDVLDEEELFIKSFLTATLLAAACSHLSLLSLARLDRRFSWTRISAVISVALLCAIHTRVHPMVRTYGRKRPDLSHPRRTRNSSCIDHCCHSRASQTKLRSV